MRFFRFLSVCFRSRLLQICSMWERVKQFLSYITEVSLYHPVLLCDLELFGSLEWKWFAMW